MFLIEMRGVITDRMLLFFLIRMVFILFFYDLRMFPFGLIFVRLYFVFIVYSIEMNVIGCTFDS